MIPEREGVLYYMVCGFDLNQETIGLACIAGTIT